MTPSRAASRRRRCWTRSCPTARCSWRARDGHSGWVNSLGLPRAGIDRRHARSADRAHRAARHGAPIGTLHEHAMALVQRGAAAGDRGGTRGRRCSAARRTCIGWASAPGRTRTSTAPEQAAYLAVARPRRADGAGGAGARCGIPTGAWSRSRSSSRADSEVADGRPARLRAAAVKLFQDGVVENATAAMLEPYLDAHGPPARRPGPEPLSARPRCATCASRSTRHASRSTPMPSATGPCARSLDALTAARRANGPRDGRHQIAHLQFIDPEDLPRFRALGRHRQLPAVLGGTWTTTISELTRPFVGDQRTERMYPFGSLARLGATLAFGSDWSVTTPDPLLILDVATPAHAPGMPGRPTAGPVVGAPGASRPRCAPIPAGPPSPTAWTTRRAPSRPAGRRTSCAGRRSAGAPGVGRADARVLLTMVDGRVCGRIPGWRMSRGDGQPVDRRPCRCRVARDGALRTSAACRLAPLVAG